MFKKKACNAIYTICLLMGLCFMLGHPAQASQNKESSSDLSMKVSYGYDGYQKYDRVMPVWIEIINKGSAFAGELTLNIDSETYAGMTFSRHVSILSKTKEEFVFYVPCLDSYTDVTFTLTDTEGCTEISFSEMTKNRNTNDLYIGILSSSPDKIRETAELMAFHSPIDAAYTAARCVTLSEHLLPETPEGYHGLDIIIANHFNAAYLTEKQASALSAWIHDGGVLLTGRLNDMDVFYTKLRLSPMSTNKIKTVTTDFEADQKTYFYNGTPLDFKPLNENPTQEEIENIRFSYYTPSVPDIRTDTFGNVGAIVLDMDILSASSNNSIINQPLYQRLDIGKGFILTAKFDFSSEVFRDFEANVYVLQSILEENLTAENWMHFFNYSGDSRSVWTSQPVLLNTLDQELPGYGKYVIILLIYILIIGPVLYFLLKKTDKRYLMWIAAPVLTIVFTAAVFAVSSNTRHTSPFINYASFIDYDRKIPSENTFYSVTLPDKGIFTQHTGSSNIRIINNNYANYDSVWENFLSNDVWTVNGNTGITYEDSSEGGIDIHIDNTSLFSTRYFSLQDSCTHAGGIEDDITFDGSRYTGTIKNNTDHEIENMSIIISGRIYSAGALKAHSEIHIDIPAQSPKSADDKTPDLDSQLLDALGITKNRKYDSASMIKMNMFMLNYSSADSHPYIFGFMPDYHPSSLTDMSMPLTGTAMFHKTVSINYTDDKGHINIPDISQMMTVKSGDIYPFLMDLYSAEAEIVYNFDNSFQPETLKLLSDSDPIDIYAYNYTSGLYDPVFKDSDTLEIKDQTYFDENKILQLKFVQKIPNTSEVYTLPVISAAGKVK